MKFPDLYLTLFWLSLQEVFSQGILTICVKQGRESVWSLRPPSFCARTEEQGIFCIASSFLSNSGKPSAPGECLLHLDLESRLDEEPSQPGGAMKALQTNNSHQPVWEGGIHKDKVSPRAE